MAEERESAGRRTPDTECPDGEREFLQGVTKVTKDDQHLDARDVRASRSDIKSPIELWLLPLSVL